jgi:hypothetical protein
VRRFIGSACAILWLFGCRDLGVTSVPTLSPEVTWSGFTDTLLSTPIDIATSNCRIAVADFGAREVLTRSESGAWTRLGNRGDGPGEYRFPTRVAFLPNGHLIVQDVSKRKLLHYDATGKFVGVGDLRQMPLGHPAPGYMEGIDSISVAEFWLAVRVPPVPIPTDSLLAYHRVARVSIEGAPLGGWGQTVAYPHPQPFESSWLINSGSFAVHDGHLYILGAMDGVLEEFDMTSGRLIRRDSLPLLRSRPSLAMVANPLHLDGEPVAGPIAVLPDGTLALVLMGATDPARSIFPQEVLVVMDSDRHEAGRFQLTTVATRRLIPYAGNRLLALGKAQAPRSDSAESVIDVLKVPNADTSNGCALH